MRLSVKICGISTPEAMEASVDGGAHFIGLNFYPRSPRAVSPNLAAQLARLAPTGVRVVGLFVDPDDDRLDEVIGQVPLDLIQLHGDETAGRLEAIRRSFNIPVMKSIPVATAEDLAAVNGLEGSVDRLLFDAKPPANVTALPGGNGIPFDWSLLAGRRWLKPWMLSGGLNAGNLAEAVAETGAEAVDVSSGVEDRPGHKSPELIRSFLKTAAAL